jgi:hypothetical protein
MDLNINNLVRSAVLLVVTLPVTVAATVALSERPPVNVARETQESLKAELTEACIKFAVSKVDSKLEREAKNDIDDVLGGEVNHREACKWAL